MLESMPPESSAPSGTSEIKRRRTAASTRSRTSASQSPSLSGSQLLELRVALDANAAALGDEHVSRRELLDARQAGAPGDVLESEIRVDGLRVDLARDAGQRQERLQLGREGE